MFCNDSRSSTFTTLMTTWTVYLFPDLLVQALVAILFYTSSHRSCAVPMSSFDPPEFCTFYIFLVRYLMIYLLSPGQFTDHQILQKRKQWATLRDAAFRQHKSMADSRMICHEIRGYVRYYPLGWLLSVSVLAATSSSCGVNNQQVTHANCYHVERASQRQKQIP